MSLNWSTKKGVLLVIFSNLEPISCIQDFHSRELRKLKMNIKARQDTITAFLTSNLLLIYVIALDIDWSFKVVSLHKFCSMLTEQQHSSSSTSAKAAYWLEFRTDLLDWVMHRYSVSLSTARTREICRPHGRQREYRLFENELPLLWFWLSSRVKSW